MKWRCTFGDPRDKYHSARNSRTVDVPAGYLDPNGGWQHPWLKGLQEIWEEIRTRAGILNANEVLIEARLVHDDDKKGKWAIPYPIAYLNFDPTTTPNKRLQRVWRDPLARTIWLAVKAQHMTNQHFERHCLNAAAAIRREKPTTVDKLIRVIRVRMPMSAPNVENKPFWEQLLECVLGKRQIGYEVIEEARVVAT